MENTYQNIRKDKQWKKLFKNAKKEIMFPKSLKHPCVSYKN